MKIHEPETPSQAATWERYKTRYLRYGLCHRCAAQIAYGHQLGFSLIEPPCELCGPLVAVFPVDRFGPWRSHTIRRWGGGGTSTTELGSHHLRPAVFKPGDPPTGPVR